MVNEQSTKPVLDVFSLYFKNFFRVDKVNETKYDHWNPSQSKDAVNQFLWRVYINNVDSKTGACVCVCVRFNSDSRSVFGYYCAPDRQL